MAIRWLKSESFWQGIAIQTLGTLIAALVVALVAILAGVGYTAAIRYFVVVGLILLIAFIAYVAALDVISKLLVRKLQNFHFRVAAVRIIYLLLAILVIGIFRLIGPQLEAALASWTGYIPS